MKRYEEMSDDELIATWFRFQDAEAQRAAAADHYGWGSFIGRSLAADEGRFRDRKAELRRLMQERGIW